MDDFTSDESGDEGDASIVKIVSDDPRAAARAAAILKLVCRYYMTFMVLRQFQRSQWS